MTFVWHFHPDSSSRTVSCSIRLLALTYFLSMACNGSLADTPDPGGAAYAAAVEQKARLAADIEVLRAEQTVLVVEDRAAGAILQDLSRMSDAELRSRLIELLDANFTGVPRAVATAVGSAPSTEDLQRDLTAARNRLIADRNVLVRFTAKNKFSGQFASLFNVGNQSLWAGGVIAFGTLLVLMLYERRQGLRRLLWVRRTRAFALVTLGIVIFAIPLLPTVLTFALGNKTEATLLKLTQRSQIADLGDDPGDQLNTIKGEIGKLEETRHKLMEERHKMLGRREQRFTEVFGDRATLGTDWKALREDVFRSYATLLVGQAMSTALKDDLIRVAALDSKINEQQKGIDDYDRTKHLRGAGIGVTLLGSVLLAGWFFQSAIEKRRKATESTCPRCLTEKSLNRESPAPGAPSSTAQLRCQSVISDMPYEECGFEFSLKYASLTKISFPTLGISQSGKTHWLAMTYQKLKEVRLPNGARLDRIESKGAREFEELVKRILHERQFLHATTNRLPEPIIFEFGDTDPFVLGGNSGLVNLFDFAGGVSMSGSLHDYVRQRQLKSEGFLFFIDPTKPKESQVDALLNFSDHIKQVKELRGGRTLHTPVALCVSKIDRTVYQDYAIGGNVMSSFFDELNKIDTTTKAMSLAQMEQRSKAVAELREVIWPGWDVEDRFRQVFGDRFLFFPMSPVGLPPRGVTEEYIIDDLSQRRIEPYGILEPLMWLLHMNGYPVLT